MKVAYAVRKIDESDNKAIKCIRPLMEHLNAV